MRKLLMIGLLTMTACGEKARVNDDKQATDQASGTQTSETNQQIDLSKWPFPIREKLEPIANLFVETNPQSYDCKDIDNYVDQVNGNVYSEMILQIDSALHQELFGSRQDMTKFKYSYLYSIEKPIQGLYPITVLQYQGTFDQPIVMILYDAAGQIVNSITIANFYGGVGDCMRSEFINDSTLLQRDQLSKIESDSTGNAFSTTAYVTREFVIHSNGHVTEKETDRRIERN